MNPFEPVQIRSEDEWNSLVLAMREQAVRPNANPINQSRVVVLPDNLQMRIIVALSVEGPVWHISLSGMDMVRRSAVQVPEEQATEIVKRFLPGAKSLPPQGQLTHVRHYEAPYQPN